MPMPHPIILRGSRDSPRARATPTMTMTRLAVLATDWVVADVFLMVRVESSLYLGGAQRGKSQGARPARNPRVGRGWASMVGAHPQRSLIRSAQGSFLSVWAGGDEVEGEAGCRCTRGARLGGNCGSRVRNAASIQRGGILTENSRDPR